MLITIFKIIWSKVKTVVQGSLFFSVKMYLSDFSFLMKWQLNFQRCLNNEELEFPSFSWLKPRYYCAATANTYHWSMTKFKGKGTTPLDDRIIQVFIITVNHL